MPLQRNATDHPLDVPAASATVQPGDTLDWPVSIAGFEPVDDEPADDDSGQDQPVDDGQEEPAGDPPPPKKTTRKRAATRPTSEEAGA